MDKWFIMLKNQNWILPTCNSFPLIVSHIDYRNRIFRFSSIWFVYKLIKESCKNLPGFLPKFKPLILQKLICEQIQTSHFKFQVQCLKYLIKKCDTKPIQETFQIAVLQHLYMA